MTIKLVLNKSEPVPNTEHILGTSTTLSYKGTRWEILIFIYFGNQVLNFYGFGLLLYLSRKWTINYLQEKERKNG